MFKSCWGNWHKLYKNVQWFPGRQVRLISIIFDWGNEAKTFFIQWTEGEEKVRTLSNYRKIKSYIERRWNMLFFSFLVFNWGKDTLSGSFDVLQKIFRKNYFAPLDLCYLHNKRVSVDIHKRSGSSITVKSFIYYLVKYRWTAQVV